MKEHQKDIRNFSETSNIVKHTNEQKYSFNFQEVKTLGNENEWTRRVTKESLDTQEQNERAINDVKYKLNIFR